MHGTMPPVITLKQSFLIRDYLENLNEKTLCNGVVHHRRGPKILIISMMV